MQIEQQGDEASVYLCTSAAPNEEYDNDVDRIGQDVLTCFLSVGFDPATSDDADCEHVAEAIADECSAFLARGCS